MNEIHYAGLKIEVKKRLNYVSQVTHIKLGSDLGISEPIAHPFIHDDKLLLGISRVPVIKPSPAFTVTNFPLL